MSNSKVIVDDRIRIPIGLDVEDDTLDQIRALFEHRNAKHWQLKKLGFKPWKEPPIIKTWRDDPSGVIVCGKERVYLTLPRGGIGKVSRFIGGRFVDLRQIGNELDTDRVVCTRELRDYQSEAIEAAIDATQGIVKMPTGSGKTTAALGLIPRLGRWALVTVHTGGLFKQWLERIEAELGVPANEVGVIGAGRFRLAPITIGMQQSLNRIPHKSEKWRDLRESFGTLIVDEVHHAAASTFFHTFDAIPATYRIGFSGTVKRKDGKEFLMHDLFGDVIYEVTERELATRGLIHVVEHRLIPTAFRADWIGEEKREGLPLDFNRLLDDVTSDDERTSLGVDWIAKEVSEGRRCLAISHRVEHCRIIDSMLTARGIRSGLMLGGTDFALEFEETRSKIQSGEKSVAVGTPQAIGEGIDLPAVDRGFVFTPVKGRQAWTQIKGRICRALEGKSDAAIYYLIDVKAFGLDGVRSHPAWTQRSLIADDGGMITVKQWVARKRATSGGKAKTKTSPRRRRRRLVSGS